MILHQLDLEAALAAKEAGQAQADANADILWREGVDRAIRRLAASGRTFTADDVRAVAGDPPPGFSPNAMGSAFTRASKAGVIRMVGFTTSSRVIGHGNTVRSWVGARARVDNIPAGIFGGSDSL